MKIQVKQTIQEYLKSFYQNDYKKTISFLDKKETEKYVGTFIAFAEQMDVFGETDEFLEKIGIDNLEYLKSLSTDDFMFKILALTKKELETGELNKMIQGIKITNIDVDKNIAIVDYTIPVSYFGEVEEVLSNVKLTKHKEDWKVHFKSSLDNALTSFQEEINLFYKRKSKDQIENLNHHPNDLEKIILVGYKNMNGDIVFEPRFKDGGDFADGYAYVKVMSKYGYIDKSGGIVIKPKYDDAKNFSEGLAAVQLPNSNYWGFINKKGIEVIPPQFDGVSEFNEELCAVLIDEKWGYINKKGKIVIPFQFEEADDFWSEETDVVRLDKDGELEYISINKQGKIVDQEE